jgi:apolipoprotein N-acyltransferase
MVLYRACSQRNRNMAAEATMAIAATPNELPSAKAPVERKLHRLDPRIAWLVAASLLLLVADGRNTIALAAWLAPACLLRFVRRETPVRGLVIAYLALVVMRGIAYRGMTPIPGIFYYLFAVISAISALIPYAVDHLLVPRLRGFAATLVFPCALVSAQFIYSHGPHGTWGTVAYTQADNLPLIQLLSVTGVWGITFLVGWFAAVSNHTLEQPRDLLPLTALTVVFLAVMLGGGARLAFFPVSSPTIRVASLSPQHSLTPAVDPQDPGAIAAGQATASQISAFRAASRVASDDLLVRSAREATAGARIVFWSETAVYLLAQDEPQLLADGRALAGRYHVYLGMALGVWTPTRARPLENKLVLIQPNGEIAWQYLKARPTPGPEAAAVEKSDGRLLTLQTPYGRIAGAICYDMDFPSLIAQAGLQRTDIMLVPASDWLGIDPRHSEIASFSAIEQGFNLVRQGNRGLSAAYDYQGRVMARMDHYQAQELTMVSQIPIRGVRTLYSRFGDWLAFLCIGALCLLGIIAMRSEEVSS